MKTSILSRLITGALFTSVAAGMWDAWWHGSVGRESFWIPPHLLLYTSIIAGVGIGFYGWYKTKDRLWRNLGIALSFIIAAGPFDELWHRMFGIEQLSSPLIVWSPPHLVIVGAIASAFMLMLPILFKDEDILSERLFGSVVFGALLALGYFLASPLNPIGPYHLLGFYGQFFDAFIFVSILLVARTMLPRIGAAFTTAIFLLLLLHVSTGEHQTALSTIASHDHAPAWLNVFSIAFPALFIDLFYKRLHYAFLGGIVNLIASGMFFYTARLFFEPEFHYSLEDATIATASAIVAGVIGGLLVEIFSKKPERGRSFQ